MTLTLPPALEKKFQQCAEQDGVTPSTLAERVLNRYLDGIERETAELSAAEEEADREGWLTTEQVMDRIHSMLRKTA